MIKLKSLLTKDALRLPLVISILTAFLFTALIWLLGPNLAQFVKGPDQGSNWYYWQLQTPNFLSQFTSWFFYAAHQIYIWVIVFLMMKEGPHPEKLTKLNYAALWGNLGFMFLHLVQSHLFYDGIAQDVPVWSSQFSVIIMLVLMAYMLIPRRGLILGKKVSTGARLMQFVRKYHGLYISWALVYTFWFHPMEGDYGLLTGFFYMFLLFIQLSFAGTKLHTAIGWVTILELTVGLHGPAIALQKTLSTGEGSGGATGVWPMFAFGFIAMYVLTGQFGFKMTKLQRFFVFALYALAAVVVYYFRSYNRLFEIVFIPLALIGGAGALALVGVVIEKLIPKKKV